MTEVCPICGGLGSKIDPQMMRCSGCGHGWRPEFKELDYAEVALHTNHELRRLQSQAAFLGWEHDPGRVLEIGCGSGHLAEHLRKFGVGFYAAIEPSTALRAGLFDRVYADLNQVEDAFDWVISSHVLEHVANPVAFLKRVSGLMVSGGHLFVEVPQESGHPAIDIDRNPGHLHFFSLASLSILLRNLGLEVVRTESHCFESIRYPHSIRVIAQKPQAMMDLSQKVKALGPIMIYGAGGIAEQMLQPLLNEVEVVGIVDSDPQKQGQSFADLQIQAPESLNDFEGMVLVSSIDYEQQIRRDILNAGWVPSQRLIGLRQLLE